MSFFESLIALLLLAVVLLQVSRRSSIPYPTMLAAAGVVVALVPGTPAIELEGHTALALFIAPILLDAGFDFPLAAIRRFWRPLVALAVVAVLLTTGVVAWIGWQFAGLPLAAAVTLGAIVAPPDAAAATTVLRSASLPRRTVQVLTGESLLNDASALLLFTGAVAIQSRGGIDASGAVRLGLAVPGGIALGFFCALVARMVMPFARGSFGGNLLEFLLAFTAWIVAERLGVSAVLCVVTLAMTLANMPMITTDARNRVQSFAVWGVVVFVLNVVAFLLMGMQARQIVGDMPPERLLGTAWFVGLVVAAVILTRMLWVLAYNRLARHFAILRGNIPPASLAQGIVIGWCGMRGLVTLATAFALPGDFPQRDLIVLSAFAVVLATLVLQGLTLSPLIKLLGLGSHDETEREVAHARRHLADAALGAIAHERGEIAEDTRRHFTIDRAALDGGEACAQSQERQRLKLAGVVAQRDRLAALRDDDQISDHTYQMLQEELDWYDLAIGPAGRQIDES
jgi:monovalent cation/hydrogen antiporter